MHMSSPIHFICYNSSDIMNMHASTTKLEAEVCVSASAAATNKYILHV